MSDDQDPSDTGSEDGGEPGTDGTKMPSLAGQFLVAMPTMTDPRFERSVVYMCAHNDEGAMGIVVNRELDGLSFTDLLGQLGVDNPRNDSLPIHFGGPVETGRGFVLHSTDYVREGTVEVSDKIGLTATIDILKAIADGEGPKNRLLALGYAGWASGQLESEIQANGWLTVEGDEVLLFERDLEQRWTGALAKIGIDASMLSRFAGSA